MNAFIPTTTNMPHVELKVPQQLNGFDCGVYICKFVELILKAAPTTTISNLQDNLSGVVNARSFSAQDAEEERDLIRSRIEMFVVAFDFLID